MSASAKRLSQLVRGDRPPHLSLHFDPELLQTWFKNYLSTLDAANAAAARLKPPPGFTGDAAQANARTMSSQDGRRAKYRSPPPGQRGKYIPLSTMYRKSLKRRDKHKSAPAPTQPKKKEEAEPATPMPPLPDVLREKLREARHKPLPATPVALDKAKETEAAAIARAAVAATMHPPPGVRRVRTPVGAGLRRSGIKSIPARPPSPAPSAQWKALGSPRLHDAAGVTPNSVKRTSWKRRSFQKFRSLQKLTHTVLAPAPAPAPPLSPSLSAASVSESSSSSSHGSRRETVIIPLDTSPPQPSIPATPAPRPASQHRFKFGFSVTRVRSSAPRPRAPSSSQSESPPAEVPRPLVVANPTPPIVEPAAPLRTAAAPTPPAPAPSAPAGRATPTTSSDSSASGTEPTTPTSEPGTPAPPPSAASSPQTSSPTSSAEDTPASTPPSSKWGKKPKRPSKRTSKTKALANVKATPSILPWLADGAAAAPRPASEPSLVAATVSAQPADAHLRPPPATPPRPPRRSSRRGVPLARPPSIPLPAPPPAGSGFMPLPQPPQAATLHIARSPAQGLALARQLERVPPSMVYQLPVCRVPPPRPSSLPRPLPRSPSPLGPVPVMAMGPIGERYPALIPRAMPAPALARALSIAHPAMALQPSPGRPATVVHGAPVTAAASVRYARMLAPRVRSITPIVQVTPPTPTTGAAGAPAPTTTIVPPLPNTAQRPILKPFPFVVPGSLVGFHRQPSNPQLAAADYQFDMEVARAARHSIERLHVPSKEVYLSLLLMFFSLRALAMFWYEWIEPTAAVATNTPGAGVLPSARERPFTALAAIRALPEHLPAPAFLISLLTRFRVNREASHTASIVANAWERPCLAAGEDWATELFRGMIAHLESRITLHLYGDIRNFSGVRLKEEHKVNRREYEIVHHLSRRIKFDAPRNINLEETWFAFLFKQRRPPTIVEDTQEAQRPRSIRKEKSLRRMRFWSKVPDGAETAATASAESSKVPDHGRHVVVGHLTGLMVKHPSFDDMTATTLYGNYSCDLTLKATRENPSGEEDTSPADDKHESAAVVGGGRGTVNGTTMLFLGCVALRDHQACVKLLNMPKTSVLIRADLARAGLVAFVGPRSLATILTMWANDIVHRRGHLFRYTAFSALLGICLVKANASVLGGSATIAEASRPANSALAHAFDLFKVFHGVNEDPAALHVTGFLYGMALASAAKHVLQTYMARHPLPRKFDWAILAALMPHNTAYLQTSSDLTIPTWRAMYSSGGIREDQIEQPAARDLLAHFRLLRAHYEADMDRLTGTPLAVATFRTQAVAMWSFLLHTLGGMFALPVPCEFTPPVVFGGRHASCSAFAWRPAKDVPFLDNLAAAHIGFPR